MFILLFLQMKLSMHRDTGFPIIISWIILLLFSFMFLPVMLSYKISWMETKWTVIHVNISNNGNSQTHSPLVKYDCWNEKDIIWTSVVSVTSHEYRVGQEIVLYCKESNPNRFLPELPVNNIFLWVGIFWLIMLISWIYKLRKSKKRKELGQ